MKKVLLSADSEISVFAVPDEVADNLEKYCILKNRTGGISFFAYFVVSLISCYLIVPIKS